MVEDCIDEMHLKKATKVRNRIRMRSTHDDKFYRKHLFYKKKWRSSLHVFPYDFKNHLEDAMYKTHEGDKRCTVGVYFTINERTHPKVTLSDAPTMTKSDMATVARVNKQCLQLMDSAIDEITSIFPKSKARKLITWRNRVARCTISKWEIIREFIWRKWAVVSFWLRITGERIGAPGGRFFFDALREHGELWLRRPC